MNRFLKQTLCLLAVLVGASCTPIVTDQTEFALHYYEVGNMLPGEPITLSPSYIGETPTDFSIYLIKKDGKQYYNPKIDKKLTPESPFYLEPTSGYFTMQNTIGLTPGTYLVSLKCVSAGIEYDFPDKMKVRIVSERE